MLNWFINLPRVAVCGRCCVNIKALPILVSFDIRGAIQTTSYHCLLEFSTFFLPVCSRRSNLPEHSCLQSAVPSQTLILCLLSGAADKFCFFALCRKHAAASCCHDGAQRWVIFTSASPHSLFWSLCVSGSITTVRCVFFCVFCFFFALLYCTLAEISTSLHLSQISKHIPVGKMLTHERGGCVYGLSILKGGKEIDKRENSFCSFKLMGTKRMSEHFYQWGLDGYSLSKASRSDEPMYHCWLKD